MPKDQEAITTVVGPDKKTVHYFSIWNASSTYWNGGPGVSATYFDRSEYGLPYTRSAQSGCAASPSASEFCLSWQEFECPNGQCNANPSRLHYVRYQGESESSLGRQSGTAFYGFGYRREVAERTKFCEKATVTNPETDCHTEHHIDVVRSRYDGLGHFRQTDTSGATSSSQSWVAGSRTEVTDYNPGFSDVSVDPVTWSNSSTPWPSSAPSLLNLFDASSATSVSQNAAQQLSTTIVKSEFCFDSTTGFLNQKRTLANPAAEGTADLLAVFGHDSNGNLTAENYFGGDKRPLPPNFAACASSTGLTADYSIAHTYASGTLASTTYLGFPNALDLTIDANSGFPSASKDPAGLQTTYQYDSLGRLTTDTPPGLAWTEYAYSPTATPPGVAIRQRPNGTSATATPITERRLYFDGIGRPIESRTRMPDAADSTQQWAVTQTTYDALGRVSGTSMPEYRSTGSYEPAFTASHWQASQYDPFGRVIKATTPDLKDTIMTYLGARSVTKQQTVNASISSITTETYDSLGRLIGVDEPSLDGTHSNTTTTYSYEAGGHLTEVDMDDHTAADLQTRLFQYDGRGFLASETHPELGRTGKGSITYDSYDARGHVGRKLVGPLETDRTASDFDLAYTYDGAERLIYVDQILNRSTSTPATQPLKQFHFATDDGTFTPVNHRTGKLDSSVRYNYPSSLPQQVITPPSGKFIVTENFFYQNGAGLLSSHNVKIEHDTQSPPLMQQTTQSYSYNDLGQVTQLTYPDCPSQSCLSGSPLTISAPLAAAYSYGRLTSLTGYGSLTYLPSGMVATLIHGQNGGVNIKDTTAGDDSGMPRPKSITFAGWDDCVRPTPSISAAGEVCPSSTSNPASVTPVAGATYQWTIINGTIRSGATSANMLYDAASSGTVTLGVTVTPAGGCGSGTDTKNVLLGATAQITSSNQTIKAGGSATIQVQLTGTANWSVTLSPINVTQSNITSSPATFTVTPSATTTYSISAVSDSVCGGTVLGGSVTITVLSPPAGFVTSKATNNSKVVSLQWNLVPSATSYQIERAAQIIGGWGVIAPSCQQLSGVMQCSDDSSAANLPGPTTYVYRVEAVANGVVSDPSAMDYATVANQLFTDEPLVGGSTLIRGYHVSELRAAVDAVRLAANKTRKWWPNYPAQTGLIMAVHFYDPNYANNLSNATDLRNTLDEAVLAIRGTRVSYSPPAPAPLGRIYAYQVEEIRMGVK
jgi:YD repeat-containing protein